jgi:HAD superfamily hydrolase (TIGR01509 family)
MKTILVDAVDTFMVNEGEGYEIFVDMYALLEQYPNKKILMTGANDEELVEWNLDKAPYEVFTLKHNPNKPDPKYFEIFLEQNGLSKDDVIYFEHNPKAVESAQSVGITSYHYDETKRDLESLKKFLDENL